MQFVQTVADLASRPQNIEILQNAGKKEDYKTVLALAAAPSVYSPPLLSSPAGVMPMLRPLMLDVVPSIQQTAALALGRLADHSDDLAEAVVKEDILPQLVHSLASQNVSTSSFGRASVVVYRRQVVQHSVSAL